MADKKKQRSILSWCVLLPVFLAVILLTVAVVCLPTQIVLEDLAPAYHGIRFTASVLFAGCGLWLGFMYPDMRQLLEQGKVPSDARQNLFRVLLEVVGVASIILIGVLTYEVLNSVGGLIPAPGWLVHGAAVFGVLFLSFLEVLCLLFVTFPVFQIWTDLRNKSEKNRSERSL